MITYFEAFSGIGGFRLGLEQAGGFKNIGYSEVNPYCIECETNTQQIILTNSTSKCDICSAVKIHNSAKIYEKHYPNSINYGDLTRIEPEQLPDFELFCGGFPCQAFSIAGKRGGFEDTRGTLFFEIMRIVKVKKPRLLFLENVQGLLNHDNGKTFYTILKSLDELGYDAEWQVLNSKHHGVPQNRQRVFIIGHLRGTPGHQIFPIRKDDKTIEGKGLAPILNCMEGGNRQPFILCDSGQGRKTQTRFKNIAPLRANKGAAYNNIVIPETAGCLTAGGHSGGLHSDMTAIIEGGGVRRLTPLECERLQGFPDNWTAGVSDTQRYKALGNAVTVNVIKAIAERLKIQGEY